MRLSTMRVWRLVCGPFLLMGLVLTIALVDAPVASASPAPNLIGAYSEDAICTSCGGATFDWTWQISSEDASTGSFSGTGTYSDGQTTSSFTGTVTGNSVDVTVSQQGGYVGHLSGNIASDCSMSGSWTRHE